MGSVTASPSLTLNGIFLLIDYTLQKVIQQVLATGPLVSHMDFQYMRDKEKSFFPPFSYMVSVSGESKCTVDAIHDQFELMLHVLHLFNFIVFDYLSTCEEGSVSVWKKWMEDIGSVANMLYKC